MSSSTTGGNGVGVAAATLGFPAAGLMKDFSTILTLSHGCGLQAQPRPLKTEQVMLDCRVNRFLLPDMSVISLLDLRPSLKGA